LITGIGALILIPSLVGVLVLHRRGILPILPWNFDVIAAWPPILSALLTLLCVIGGVLFGRLIVLRFLARARQDRPLHEWLLDTVTLFLLIAPLVFLQFGDEYLLPILPYSLIIVGRVILPHLNRIILGSIVGVALAILMVSILWERDYLAYNAAMWSASEALRREGVVPEEIASLWEWESYYGSVDRFIASTNGSQSVSYYFQIWLPEQQANARYQVTTESVDRNKWQKITCIPYWNMWLRQQQVCSYKRSDH
jgi:hypothetical protein